MVRRTMPQCGQSFLARAGHLYFQGKYCSLRETTLIGDKASGLWMVRGA